MLCLTNLMEVEMIGVWWFVKAKDIPSIHLPLKKTFDIFSPNLTGVHTFFRRILSTWIDITFYEPSLVKFIYKRRYIPPSLIHALFDQCFKELKDYLFSDTCSRVYSAGVWGGASKIEKSCYFSVTHFVCVCVCVCYN